ncbi:MAG: Ldh family oxidoreductase, partial [Pseudomonadota bacterium]
MVKYYDSKFLENYFSKVFKKLKIKKRIYKPVVDGLIETSYRGVDSHGIELFPKYVDEVLEGRININPNFVFEKTSSSVLVLDADHTFGITSSFFAINKAIKV